MLVAFIAKVNCAGILGSQGFLETPEWGLLSWPGTQEFSVFPSFPDYAQSEKQVQSKGTQKKCVCV